ncbi:MAG: hypothetical protein HY923_03940 [Elusimicrobia bacterium]|nr:hypothetical protein [Elusimicrobiota bacterium]
MPVLKRLTALLLSALLTVPASAQLVVRAGPSAIGGAVSAAGVTANIAPNVPEWKASFTAFLTTPSPDLTSVRAISRALEKIDLNDPKVRAELAPLAQAIAKHAKPLLAKPKPGATDEELVQTGEKLDILNYPAIRALLPEAMQSQIGAADWVYGKALWNPTGEQWTRKQKTLETLIEDIAKGLERPSANLADTPAPKTGQGPEVSLQVLTGNIAEAGTKAVMTTVQEKHLCQGGVNSVVANANPCFFQRLQKAPELKDGEALLAKGDGKGPIENVVFVKDQSEKPLSEIVYAGLKEADQNGLESVAVPAMRAGSVFGAVERSYREIALQVREGVERFMAEARTSLKSIALVVYNDDKLARVLNDAFAERVERERSLRTDLREAKLSNDGYTLTPEPNKPEERSSPIYETLLKPWSLKYLLKSHKPVRIGAIVDKETFSKKVTSVLNMPVKLPGGKVTVPKELAQFREFLQKVIDHEKAVNPDFNEYYMYFTVDQHQVKKGSTHRRPGVHIDGVQGARYEVKLPPEHLYSASDALGTVFYDQVFDLTALDPAKHHVHAELERQAKEENGRATPNYDIAFWDSYSVHRADLAKEDMMRTFVRVEFSKKIYDSEGDTVNPALDYHWERIARPIPAGLDDRPIFHNGYHQELKDLDPNAPHTVKNVRKWIEENIGVEPLSNGRAFFIAEGDTAEERSKLESEGWRIGLDYPKEVGFHRIYDATSPSEEKVNLVLGVNGQGRIVHLQSFLKLAGVKADQVMTRRGFRSWKPEYKRAFEALGKVPDLVVYGLTRPAMRALIGDGPGLEEFWRDFNAKSAPQDNDISRRPMKAVILADGRTVWFFMPLFGELAGDLMEAVLEYGAKNVLVTSAAGAMDENMPLGTWFDPREGGHVSMATSNTQTQAWLARQQAAGNRTVDMEYGPIMKAFAAHPDAALKLAYFVSDVMAGPHRTDLTEVRIGKIKGVSETALALAAEALGAKPGELKAVSAVNRGF